MSETFILEARALRKYFPTGASKMLQRPTDLVRAVDDVSFGLRRGSTLAIVGSPDVAKPRWGVCWPV